MTTKDDSVTEIQVSDLDTSTEIRENDSMGWMLVTRAKQNDKMTISINRHIWYQI